MLTGFGYYYKGRFIRGKMYDTNEAWKIYTAVTSRGRDPGIMDRPDAQDYHAQIYPVEAGHDLRVVVDLRQALASDRDGAHFALPLSIASENSISPRVQADVQVLGHQASGDHGQLPAVQHVRSKRGRAVARLRGRWKPNADWLVTIPRRFPGVTQSVYSARNPSRRNGYFALAVTAPYQLVNPRVSLSSRPGTNDTLPTRFSTVPAYGRLLLTGRYYGPGKLGVTLHSKGRAALHFTVPLSGQVVPEHENPAAGLWGTSALTRFNPTTPATIARRW